MITDGGGDSQRNDALLLPCNRIERERAGGCAGLRTRSKTHAKTQLCT